MREIRRARPEDARGIAQVHVQSWKETYTGQIDAAFLAERSEEKSLRAFEKMKCRNMVTALDHGEIIGFAGFGPVLY